MGTNGTSTFGERLRESRVAAGLSQEALAERAGLSVREISEMERGVRSYPRLQTVRALADALGISSSESTDLLAAAHPPESDWPHDAPFSGTASSLPRPLTSLIGREGEIAAVVALLRDASVSMVTLTGPGGVGKTRMALQVAATVRDEFADGVTFVPLASIQDPALVFPTIARALGVRDAESIEHVQGALENREVLLLLDSCEHVIDAAPAVAELLTHLPTLTVLSTSRARLQISGEHVFPLAPLPVPPDTEAGPINELLRVNAIRLFVERSRAARPDFALTADNAAAIVDICRHVDGLPLAIELAAARTKVLPPVALRSRLKRRLPLLTGGGRDTPERHQTLYRTIAWSYDLLAPIEQRFFRYMAVFQEGFTLEAAEAVWGTASNPELDTFAGGSALGAAEMVWGTVSNPELDTFAGISSLVDKSLIRPVGGVGDEPRYAMLETIREFGTERLIASGDETAARHAHADWFLDFARNAAAAFKPVIQLISVDRLEAEHANIHAALTWLEETDRTDDFSRLAVDLGWFWYLGGHEREGLGWLKRALALRQEGDTPLDIDALLRAGELAQMLDDPAAAHYLEEGRALAQRFGNLSQEANGTKLLGIMAEDEGDYERAEPLLAAAKALYEQLNDPWYPIVMEYHLGVVAYGRGDIATAITLLESARAAAESLGDELVPAWCTPYLTLITCDQDSPGRAASLLRRLQHPEMLSTTSGLHFNHFPVYLGTVAVLATKLEQWRSAAWLLGSAVADYRDITFALPEGTAFGRAEAEARRQMGDDAYTEAWKTGRGMRHEETDREVDRLLTMAEHPSIPAPTAREPSLLTPREQEVLRLLVEGRTNREIAAALFISPRTVTTHVTNILTKFGVETRAAAVTYAFHHGLV